MLGSLDQRKSSLRITKSVISSAEKEHSLERAWSSKQEWSFLFLCEVTDEDAAYFALCMQSRTIGQPSDDDVGIPACCLIA